MPSLTLCLFGLTVALVPVVGLFPRLTRSHEGKILAFVALLILPVLSMWAGFQEHMQLATSTSFCLSCHVMTDYGRSLYVDDRSYVPARHFQNNLIPRDRACYTCHTDYTMFGTITSKIRGMRHLWVQYAGKVPKPEEIKLYTPFNNRECLHCHLGARKFEEHRSHHKTPELLDSIKAGTRSCTSSGCHDTIHDLRSLKDAEFWKEAK